MFENIIRVCNRHPLFVTKKGAIAKMCKLGKLTYEMVILISAHAIDEAGRRVTESDISVNPKSIGTGLEYLSQQQVCR